MEYQNEENSKIILRMKGDFHLKNGPLDNSLILVPWPRDYSIKYESILTISSGLDLANFKK